MNNNAPPWAQQLKEELKEELKDTLKDAMNEGLKKQTQELKQDLTRQLGAVENSLKTVSQLSAIVRGLASRGDNLRGSLRSNRTVITILVRGPTSFHTCVFRLTTGPILLSTM